MRKLFVSLCCILLCTACGGALAGELKKRKDILEALCRDIRSMRGWIAFDRLPVGELLYRLRGSQLAALWNMAAKRNGEREKSFAEIWRECVFSQRELLLSPLREEETELLIEFGSRLGSLTDTAAQLAQIDMTLGRLELCIREARNEMHKKDRLIRSLGAMGGLAITIMLW